MSNYNSVIDKYQTNILSLNCNNAVNDIQLLLLLFNVNEVV